MASSTSSCCTIDVSYIVWQTTMPVINICLIKNCFMQNNAAGDHLSHKNVSSFVKFLREPEDVWLHLTVSLFLLTVASIAHASPMTLLSNPKHKLTTLISADNFFQNQGSHSFTEKNPGLFQDFPGGVGTLQNVTNSSSIAPGFTRLDLRTGFYNNSKVDKIENDKNKNQLTAVKRS